MNSSEVVLVAVDFSNGSHAALIQAAQVAAARQAMLHVLHVVDSAAVATLADMQGGGYDSHAAIAAEGAQAALDRWLAQCGLRAPCQGTVAVGHPLHEILEHVRTSKASLLVAGLQGAGQSTEGAGSVAAKLARHCPVSVLLVRAGHTHAFQRILACLDFSPAADRVMQEAVAMARQCDTGLECLHVWREPWVVAFDPETTITSAYPVIVFTPHEREAHMEQLRQQLHSQVAASAGEVACTEVLQEAMHHGSGILARATQSQPDLVVIGSSGRSKVRQILLGSTAERLLARAPCSVLVVRIPNGS